MTVSGLAVDRQLFYLIEAVIAASIAAAMIAVGFDWHTGRWTMAPGSLVLCLALAAVLMGAMAWEYRRERPR